MHAYGVNDAGKKIRANRVAQTDPQYIGRNTSINAAFADAQDHLNYPDVPHDEWGHSDDCPGCSGGQYLDEGQGYQPWMSE